MITASEHTILKNCTNNPSKAKNFKTVCIYWLFLLKSVAIRFKVAVFKFVTDTKVLFQSVWKNWAKNSLFSFDSLIFDKVIVTCDINFERVNKLPLNKHYACCGWTIEWTVFFVYVLFLNLFWREIMVPRACVYHSLLNANNVSMYKGSWFTHESNTLLKA